MPKRRVPFYQEQIKTIKMSYYPPSIRPNGFIETEKKTTKITKTKKMDMIAGYL
jgi:hypothetical protein